MTREVWKQFAYLAAESVSIPGMVSHLAMPCFRHLGGDRYRCFFSYRDANLRAHAGSVDLELSETAVTHSNACGDIIEMGSTGCYDEHGVIPACFLPGEEPLSLLYNGRSQGETSPMFYAGIGLARAGTPEPTFIKHAPVPVFDRNAFDPCFVLSPHVMRHDGRFLMHYIACYSWDRVDGELHSNYEIRRAYSDNGIDWEPEGIAVLDRVAGERNVARPWLNQVGDGWHLWYSSSGDGYPYRIGRSRAPDLLHWTREDEILSFEFLCDDDFQEMQCYPTTLDWRDRTVLAFNGNRFGRDGIGFFMKASA
jgi:hypothetical protein